MKRTNCDNCGGILVNGDCPYCGAQWFKPFDRVGESGYISDSSIKRHEVYSDFGRSSDGTMSRDHVTELYSVSLSIVGLTKEEVAKIFASYNKS